uniref:SHOCT domain-containing protein n=1 Tax=Rhizochromulina marina TaxID=1034831 RepID=A0A7S2WNZ8_9STRA|mmetsp:Transcript_28964/g.84549  ORF Transcript_28964/g.84549 Transcript_28964/m.84549 type:complete len:311 (+) Transcript_28964:54-986(+)
MSKPKSQVAARIELKKQLDELAAASNLSVEQRVNHIRKLQKEDGIEIYAIQFTTIQRAAQTNEVTGIKHFVEKGLVDHQDDSGNTALHEGARFGFLPIVNELVSSGANINACNHLGQTPFHLAVGGGHIHLLEVLYDKGADAVATDGGGATGAHYAAQANRVDLLEELYKLQEFPLGPEVLSIRSKNGQTPAHMAAQFDGLEALDYLMRKGVDITVKDRFGETPAHKAARARHTRVLRGMSRIGTDFGVANVDEDTVRDLVVDQSRHWREGGGESMASLRELVELRRDGEISHAEYQRRKNSILGASGRA